MPERQGSSKTCTVVWRLFRRCLGERFVQDLHVRTMMINVYTRSYTGREMPFLTPIRTACTALQLRTPAVLCLILLAAARVGAAADFSGAAASRQSLDDAWWTGPILAASASTLPRGRVLIEPYVFDAISYGRYDADGDRRNTDDSHSFGSLTYMLYGLTDRVTVGLIPTFAFNDVNGGADSSGIRVGDLTLQAQYRLTQFREGGRIPTLSIVLQETLPTGQHDRLGSRPSDGVAAGRIPRRLRSTPSITSGCRADGSCARD